MESFYLPRRYVLYGFFVSGIVAAYLIRVTLSVAIVQIRKEQGWDPKAEGLVLSSFYWGYIITQLPGGWLAKKFGGKNLFVVGLFAASILTVLFSWCTYSLPLAIAVRVLTGIGEGVLFSAFYVMVSVWVPFSERTTVGGLIQGSAPLGTVLSLGVSPTVILAYGWQWLFWGTDSLLWLICFFLFTRTTPESGFTLLPPSQEEIDYIAKNLNHAIMHPGRDQSLINSDNGASEDEEDVAEKARPPKPTPWGALLTNPAVIALVYNHFAYNWNSYIFISWLPTYTERELHFDVHTGIYNMAPYFFVPIIALISGVTSDWLIQKKGVDILSTRKFFQCTSAFFPACMLIILSFVKMGSMPTFAVMVLAISTSGLAGGGYSINFIDLTRDHVSALWSFSNCVATIPGIVGVYFTGYILDSTNYNWRIVFLLAAAVDVLAMYTYQIWGKATPIFPEEEKNK